MEILSPNAEERQDREVIEKQVEQHKMSENGMGKCGQEKRSSNTWSTESNRSGRSLVL